MDREISGSKMAYDAPNLCLLKCFLFLHSHCVDVFFRITFHNFTELCNYVFGDSESTSRISRYKVIPISMKMSNIFFLYREEEMLDS